MAKVSITKDGRCFCFGKYNGYTVGDVINMDVNYIQYLMNSKISWLFTDSEIQHVRNIQSKSLNTDVHSMTLKHRSNFENEMYHILKQVKFVMG